MILTKNCTTGDVRNNLENYFRYFEQESLQSLTSAQYPHKLDIQNDFSRSVVWFEPEEADLN